MKTFLVPYPNKRKLSLLLYFTYFHCVHIDGSAKPRPLVVDSTTQVVKMMAARYLVFTNNFQDFANAIVELWGIRTSIINYKRLEEIDSRIYILYLAKE